MKSFQKIFDEVMKRKNRIDEEIKEFNEWKHTINCEGSYSSNDSTLTVIMDGPKDSPYIGGKFKITVTFPQKYPTEKPIFKFITPICHINISGTSICLDSINNYSENSSITDTLTQIFMMLTSPNEDSPLNTDYYNLYIKDLDEYFAKARKMTSEYAK
jgi:ubiquitin-protein ligase